MMDSKLLIIDDDLAVSSLFQDVAEEVGFEVIATHCADQFFASLASFSPDLIIIDLMMPDMDGVEILRKLSEKNVDADIILSSGADEKVLRTAASVADGYGLKVRSILPKPLDLEMLKALLIGEDPIEDRITIDDLAYGIENNELVIFYQPKISFDSTGNIEIKEAEALVRWQHPRKGLVFPDQFIELAEQTDLIGPLTSKVIETSLAQINKWRSAGKDIKVAVNLAPQSLTDISLPDRIAAMAAKANVPCENLILEITERAAMDDSINVMDILTRFRLKNFCLSMDDFGTGYSSLRELYRMPFNELKIDRSFVSEISKSKDAKIIVQAVVGLAHNLGLSVCAEGVENKSELFFLQSIGCKKYQGYYFHKPMPADEFTKTLMHSKETELV